MKRLQKSVVVAFRSVTRSDHIAHIVQVCDLYSGCKIQPSSGSVSSGLTQWVYSISLPDVLVEVPHASTHTRHLRAGARSFARVVRPSRYRLISAQTTIVPKLVKEPPPIEPLYSAAAQDIMKLPSLIRLLRKYNECYFCRSPVTLENLLARGGCRKVQLHDPGISQRRTHRLVVLVSI